MVSLKPSYNWCTTLPASLEASDAKARSVVESVPPSCRGKSLGWTDVEGKHKFPPAGGNMKAGVCGGKTEGPWGETEWPISPRFETDPRRGWGRRGGWGESTQQPCYAAAEY